MLDSLFGSAKNKNRKQKHKKKKKKNSSAIQIFLETIPRVVLLVTYRPRPL